MIDRPTALQLAEAYRLAGGYRPFLLTLWVLAHAEGECWEPPSKAYVKRKLTRPRDEFDCSDAELETAVAIAVAHGLLGEGSTIYAMTLNLDEGQVAA
ncbi:hypothetical protein ACTXKE_02690 [Brachybacterium alimentarium]|uniref:hypothetical protein n=1 Tax=Brachybacterium alimentarium TaxID=47845 RepID=UPI003FD50488